MTYIELLSVLNQGHHPEVQPIPGTQGFVITASKNRISTGVGGVVLYLKAKEKALKSEAQMSSLYPKQLDMTKFKRADIQKISELTMEKLEDGIKEFLYGKQSQ